jgi:hypothetical protein
MMFMVNTGPRHLNKLTAWLPFKPTFLTYCSVLQEGQTLCGEVVKEGDWGCGQPGLCVHFCSGAHPAKQHSSNMHLQSFNYITFPQMFIALYKSATTWLTLHKEQNVAYTVHTLQIPNSTNPLAQRL